jgi:hypothetical protein
MRPLPVLLLTAALLAGCGQAGGGTAGGAGVPGGPADGAAGAAAPEPCPERVEPADPPAVPHPPSADTGGRLVPDAVPTAAVLCRYAPGSNLPAERGTPGAPGTPATPEPGTLVGERPLTGGLDRVPHDLLLPRALPGQTRPCTLIGGAVTPYLLRLDYPDGQVWVATAQDPNSCRDAGNGELVTKEPLGDRFAASYDAGAWTGPVRRGGSPCEADATGRAGQEGALVPGEPTALDVCVGDATRAAGQDLLREVRAVLADPVAVPSQGSCTGEVRGWYELLFRYDSGPPVLVRFLPGCEPDVDNGSLQAQLDPDSARRLEHLLG